MNQSIRELVDIADKIEKLEKEKTYYADRIRTHKSTLDDDENKFLECERKLAVLYKAIHKCDVRAAL